MTATPTSTPSCAYASRGGAPCPEPAQGRAGLCFWHDPACAKVGAEIKPRLEALAREDRSLEGYVLRGADLRDVHLTFGDTRRRVNLSHADLSRTNLADGHLFNIDLRGANLMKASLNGANLNSAYLDGANLLGTEFDGARLERVHWGRHLHQELLAHQAFREGREEQALTLYGEAEVIYRVLTGVAERAGHHAIAGHFYRNEKIMRRMQMPMWSRDRAWSKLVDLLCGYGEETDRVIAFSLLVIVLCAAGYFLLGVRGPEGELVLNPQLGVVRNLLTYGECVYFSVITFTTTGYGDVTPIGIARLLSMLEAFTGQFSISLFVVVFVRKMMR